MKRVSRGQGFVGLGLVLLLAACGCRSHMPHAFTWPAGGDIIPTHAAPPEGGYYSNWDPWAVELEVWPENDVNPVQTQHIIIATVKDKDGKPLENRRVEWMIASGSVGDFVEVDESGWRASRGYKVDNHYAVTHTNNCNHTLDMGTEDPSDDVELTVGQTWAVITSPIEGDTHVTVYAPGINDWSQHKKFVTKHWYDIAWEFPPAAVNPIGTEHQFVTSVMKHSDGSPLEGYIVNYEILDGPAASFTQGSGQTASVMTDASGLATVTLRQAQPAEGTNNVKIDIIRPADLQCCKPAAHIATGETSKTWIGPKIGITKDAPARELVNNTFNYTIVVNNPSQVAATNVVVTDVLPDGIRYVSSSPSAQAGGQNLSWSLGTLDAGASSNITVQVQGTRTGTFDNCAEVRADYGLSARDCAQTVIVAPALRIEKTCTPEVLLCDPIHYTITITNTGDGPANNVEIRESLPDGITTTRGNASVFATIPSLAAGESKTYEFTANASRTGSFTNTVSATADGGLTAEDSCQTVVRKPELQVTKTGPAMRFVNRKFEWEITVTNTGDIAATNTVLTDTLPNGAEFVSATEGGQASGNRVTWNLGTLAAGDSRRVTVTVIPRQRAMLENLANATANCAEDSATAMTEIKGIPAILLEVIDQDDPIELGTQVTYEITVTNQGSADGTNIVVECTLPDEGVFVSANGLTPATASGKVVRFAPLPMLQPKAKAAYYVVVEAAGSNDVRFKVSMTSDQTSSPVEETESTNFYE